MSLMEVRRKGNHLAGLDGCNQPNNFIFLLACAALRNPQIQPLIMHEGHVRGVNKRDPFLQTLKTKYGSNTAKYFVEKLRESEEYNPSGRYPVVVSDM